MLLRAYGRMLKRIYDVSYGVGGELGRRLGIALYGPPDPDAAVWRAADEVFSRASALRHRADLAAAAGRLDAARRLYGEAASTAREVHAADSEDSQTLAAIRVLRAFALLNALSGSADLDALLGRRDEELAHLQAARQVMHEVLPGTIYDAMALNRIGVALFEAGAVDEAIDTHERALRMLDEAASLPAFAPAPSPAMAGIRSIVLSSLGNGYTAAGSRDRGAQLTRQALAELPESARGGRDEAACLSNAADAELPFGDLAKAEEYLRRAVDIDVDSAPRHRLAVLNNLGNTRLLLGDATGARNVLEEAERLLHVLPRDRMATTVLNNLAIVELRSDRPNAAVVLFDRATSAGGGAAGASAQLAWAQANLAAHHLDSGRVDDAVRVAAAGVATAETVRAERPTPWAREELSEHLQAPYQALIAALYATGDPGAHARAFSVAEMSRARGLGDTFAAGPAVNGPPEIPVDLRDRHARARRALLEATEAPADELRRLESAERRLAWEIERTTRVPRPAEHVPVDVAAVQTELGARTLLLSYEFNGRGVFVWAVRRHALVMLRLANDVGEIVPWLRTSLPVPGRPPETTSEERRAHLELGSLLLGQLPAEHLDDADRVVVIPGLLASLPLELLPLSPGRLLGDVVPVSYVPSAATVLELGRRHREERRAPTRGFLGVAPVHEEVPLPAARRELHRVAARFTAADLVEGPRADVAAVLRDVGTYRHVHLACHGYLDPVQPMQSGFLLDGRPGAETDGSTTVLHLHALGTARLRADTVVCAACETGLGRLREGEGMVGFGTALLAAGARFLLLNIRPVRDTPTARLVTRFYDELLDGNDPVMALWRAKLWARRTRPEVYADPLTWAALIAVGVAPPTPAPVSEPAGT